MEALLTDDWLGAFPREQTIDEASVSVVRERVRTEGAAIGMPATTVARLVSVASELGHNQLKHARRGSIAVRRIERDGVAGLEVIAADRGRGIAHPADALRGVPRAPSSSKDRTSLGVGLSAVLDLSDEVDFDVRLDEGTCVWARVFGDQVRRRRVVGIYGRACKGEEVSGDHACFVRDENDILLAVADGLGHGRPARQASALAMRTVRDGAANSLEETMEACHRQLVSTRGAVLGLARVPEPGESLETLVMGNIALHCYGPGRAFQSTGPAVVVGSPTWPRKLAAKPEPLGARDVVVMFTDGLTSRTTLDGELDLLREHPIVIAERCFERFARDSDDSLVAVIR